MYFLALSKVLSEHNSFNLRFDASKKESFIIPILLMGKLRYGNVIFPKEHIVIVSWAF
jgi:hypothetical protein